MKLGRHAQGLAPKRQLIINWGAILALVVLLNVGINYFLQQKQLTHQRERVTGELAMIRVQVEAQLNANLYLIYGMAAYIANHPNLSTAAFNAYAKELLDKSDSIKNVAAAPDFTISFVYPFEGNQAILGVNYKEVPAQWQKALHAKETGQMALAGPLNLIQGGTGLIARIPVFLSEDDSFWGLVSSVMDMDQLADSVGLNRSLSLALAVRGKDGLGASGEVFWGSESLFRPKAQAVLMPVSLPTGSWQMAAIPKSGWHQRSEYTLLIHLASLFLCLVLGFSSYLRMRSQLQIADSERRLKAMSEASLDALVMTNERDVVQFWNPAAEQLFGFEESEALGQQLSQLIHPQQSSPVESEPLTHNMGHSNEVRVTHKSGASMIVEQSTAPFLMAGNQYAVTSLRDITARKQVEQHLMEMATTDELTGLSNRRHFVEQAQSFLNQSKRYQHPFSLLLFDIDFFKRINDSFGHGVGDKVLKLLGAEVLEVLRTTDVVGRLGGEEFVVAMPETDLKLAEQVAQRLRIHLMNLTTKVPEGVIKFTVSLGVTELGADDSLEALMQQADEALYQAKAQGRNRVVCYAKSNG